MPAKFSLFTVAALPLIPVALACGGDDGGGKITVRPDSNTADATPVACTAAGPYGDILAGSDGSNIEGAGSAGMMGGTGSDAYEIYWFGRPDPVVPPDIVELLMFESGPFATGITPQTVQLTGDETAIDTCSACVLLLTDLHTVGSDVEYTDVYFVTGGTLSLTSTSDTLTGEITNASFTHVVQSGNTFVSANDGCNATAPKFTINAPIDPQGSAAGKPMTASDRINAIKYSIQHRTF
jgi:hypothetical protein